MKTTSALAGLALGLAGLGSALAQNSSLTANPNTANPHVPVAPSGFGGTGLGSSQLFAVVNANGVIIRGKGDASSARSAVGTYQVRFQRNVRNCAYVATIGLPGATGASVPSFITVAAEAASVNGVLVRTHNIGGGVADRPFHLYVDC